MSGTVVRGGAGAGSAQTVTPVTCKGAWTTIHDDLEASPESAAVLKRPLSNTGTNAHPCAMSENAGKWVLRVRYDATAAITTSPVIQLFAVYGHPATDGNFLDDGTVAFMRLDNSDSAAAGLTLTLDATNDVRDTTYRYSDPVSFTPQDALGAWYILALTETAANTSAGAVVLQIMCLN